MSGSSSKSSKKVYKNKDKEKYKDEDKGNERNKHRRPHGSSGGSSSRPSRVPNRKDYGEDYQQTQPKVPQSELIASELFRDELQPAEPRSSKHHHHPSTSTQHDRQLKPPSKDYPHSTMYKPTYDESQVQESAIKFKTEYSNPKDIEMAERQTRITTLSGNDRQKQEKWAKEKLSVHGACPAGFDWWEYDRGIGSDGGKLQGYRCWAGSHLVTHELLAEGRNRYYSLDTQLAHVIPPGLSRGRFPLGSLPGNAIVGGRFPGTWGFPRNPVFQVMQAQDVGIPKGHLRWTGPFEAPPPEFVNMMQNAYPLGPVKSQLKDAPQWHIHKT